MDEAATAHCECVKSPRRSTEVVTLSGYFNKYST